MIDWYEIAGRQLDADPDADPVVAVADERFATLRGRIEACERRFADAVAAVRSIADLLDVSRDDHAGLVLAVGAVERAGNTLAVYSGAYGWLKAADLYQADRVEALVAYEVARDREERL